VLGGAGGLAEQEFDFGSPRVEPGRFRRSPQAEQFQFEFSGAKLVGLPARVAGIEHLSSKFGEPTGQLAT
jgi:hypothetical protein